MHRVALYDSLSIHPLVTPQPTLCDGLKAVHDAMNTKPDCTTVSRALQYIQMNKFAILRQFGLCAWTYACCQQQPPLSWGECVDRLIVALEGVLQHRSLMQKPYCAEPVDANAAWAVALDAWNKFYLALSTGCCAKLPNGDRGSRYVIRQTPNVAPYYGRTICVPTLTPAKLTERSYATQAECEMAVEQLPPQVTSLPFLENIYCNDYGCYQVPGWGVLPDLGTECSDSGLCCGCPDPRVTAPAKPHGAYEQYQFYY